MMTLLAVGKVVVVCPITHLFITVAIYIPSRPATTASMAQYRWGHPSWRRPGVQADRWLPVDDKFAKLLAKAVKDAKAKHGKAKRVRVFFRVGKRARSMIIVPIPRWTAAGVIPPVNSTSATSAERSPYTVSLSDVVLQLAASAGSPCDLGRFSPLPPAPPRCRAGKWLSVAGRQLPGADRIARRTAAERHRRGNLFSLAARGNAG